MVLSIVRSAVAPTATTHGRLSQVSLTRWPISIDLARRVNAGLSPRMAHRRAANSMQNLPLPATLRPTDRWLGLIAHLKVHVAGMLIHALVVTSSHSILDRTELIVGIMCSIVWLENIGCAGSFALSCGLWAHLVWLSIHNHRWFLLEQLLKVQPLCSQALLCLHLSIVQLDQSLQLADHIGAIVGMLCAGVGRKPEHFQIGKVR